MESEQSVEGRGEETNELKKSMVTAYRRGMASRLKEIEAKKQKKIKLESDKYWYVKNYMRRIAVDLVLDFETLLLRGECTWFMTPEEFFNYRMSKHSWRYLPSQIDLKVIRQCIQDEFDCVEVIIDTDMRDAEGRSGILIVLIDPDTINSVAEGDLLGSRDILTNDISKSGEEISGIQKRE